MKYEENSKILSLLHAHGIEMSAKLELPVSGFSLCKCCVSIPQEN